MWNLIFKNDTNELIHKTGTDLEILKLKQRGNMEVEGISGHPMNVTLFEIQT